MKRARRTTRAKKSDIARSAHAVGSPRNPKAVRKWRKAPARMDLWGVDSRRDSKGRFRKKGR